MRHAGGLRESDPGQSQYSPITQHEKIVAAMSKNGHFLSCIDGDERKGHIAARRGYQNIKARVEAGLTTAVYVVHSSRLGRDASERMTLSRELRKLGVPIYSVHQGELKDDLVGGVYALLDQQFSVDLAFKIKNALPQAVKAGQYPARTPLGYKRIWPEGQPYKRKQPALMVIDEHYGPLVQQVFATYGVERWTMRSIVRWLNGQVATYPNPDSPSGIWTIERLSRILRNPIYSGQIVWGKTKSGYYDHYEGEVLRSDEGDCGPSRHPPLIDDETWKAVQMRLQHEDQRRPPRTRRGRTPALLSGFLVCAGCGSHMHTKGGSADQGRHGAPYVCGARGRGQSDCRAPGCVLALANDAVLREVSRLRGTPWPPPPLETTIPPDPHAAERAAIEAQIAAAKREVDRNIKLLKLLEDPDKETLDGFRRDNRRLADEIA
ncbi:MAG TPA: recombinase family protein [Chloroflexota bacterium]|nr:recombinase family protein [Chloroflexota bacterium]